MCVCAFFFFFFFFFLPLIFYLFTVYFVILRQAFGTVAGMKLLLFGHSKNRERRNVLKIQ